MRFILLLFLQFALFAVDYDCIVVGTSPFSLFEALYHAHSGKKVLIVEQAAECGGAWKSIHICGIPHVDLGCHETGHNQELSGFLTEYAGCKIVSMSDPLIPFESHAKSPMGWYFSSGCFELIDHLLELIRKTNIRLLLNCKVENVTVPADKKTATIHTKTSGSFSTNKLILTPMSCLTINGFSPQPCGQSKYYHLYLLIQDPTPPRFTYQNGSGAGVSRMMNLSHFLNLPGTGRQLIIFQVHGEQYLTNPQMYLDTLKMNKLVDQGAYILTSQPYVYESGFFNQSVMSQLGLGAQGVIEVIQTGHFQNLASYISKWKTVLKPYATR